ncbi:MAG: Uncharacterized protein G01um101430_98 [Parcubacteria group bacterium Gr01-1014_30]|nr:MAG: Uncharacterized protein G01um101430_98 [Parcubacteria group bacterium Gr01-1014_30]
MTAKSIVADFDFTKQRDWTTSFLHFGITQFEKLLTDKPESFWQKEGEKRALKLFHAVSQRVPAYKTFLKKHKINPKNIRTLKDFAQVPPTDKKTYIRKYPLIQRCWDGKLETTKLVAISSGTSGEPTFWPRSSFQEFEAAIIHELLYRYLFDIHKYRTLLIVGFPMGTYVSGIATLLPSWLVAQKGYNLTVASVGTNKQDILKVAMLLQKNYEQIILVGHPFFMKDVVETGREIGLQWGKKRLKFMFCSEGFSEEWRSYVLKQVKASVQPADMISTYGSSELLLIAWETPASIALKAAIETSKGVKGELLHRWSPSNLFQYNPLFRYIESVKDELLFTSASGIPLIRYNLHDMGRVISLDQAKRVTSKLKVRWQFPFLALGGRSDYAVVFYAANIYPEHIRQALDYKPFLTKLTGKFVMRKDYTKKLEEFLEINVELKNRASLDKPFERAIQKRVIDHLQSVNMEYLFLRNNLKQDLRPRIKLWPYQHERYFKLSLKPRYILSN